MKKIDGTASKAEMAVSPTSDKLYCLIYCDSNPDVN
jgi:hypothetical protein